MNVLGSSKRIKIERQAKALPMRSSESGFSWYKRKCCELKCDDCGIKARFHHSEGSVAAVVDVCNCEFDCRDNTGTEIEVVVKVKMYCDQIRSGGFQKEMEEVDMTLPAFKEHFMKCARKYLVHHFNDILSSQARRNLYEKMPTDPNLSNAIILASDYSAVMDGHSQDQLNQTTQLHSLQLVVLASYLSNQVLKTSAYSFWNHQGTSKLKSDNHFYRQCKDRVLSDLREKVKFKKLIEITDGAPTQFKNRFNTIQLSNVVRKYELDWAMAVYPPTATFKGEHDGVGNLDKNVIRKAELAEIGRYPRTRSFMPLLWEQPPKTPRALDDPNRKTHEIDEHIRIYVTDLPHALPTDAQDKRILITNKAIENFECTNVPGIQGCYNFIVLKNDTETGAINESQTIYLRDAFCSCDSCRGANALEDFTRCRY
jgi:hypothetical protein